MTLGKTYTAESGADCDNATDDNGNGAINDGCPQVGATAETALVGPVRQRDRRRRRGRRREDQRRLPRREQADRRQGRREVPPLARQRRGRDRPVEPDAADRLDRRPDPVVDRRLPSGRARRVPGLPEHGGLRPVRRLRDGAGLPACGRRVADREHHLRGREHLRPEHVGRRGRPVDRHRDPRAAARLDDDRARPPHGHAQPAGRPRRLGVRRCRAAGDRPLARRGRADRREAEHELRRPAERPRDLARGRRDVRRRRRPDPEHDLGSPRPAGREPRAAVRRRRAGRDGPRRERHQDHVPLRQRPARLRRRRRATRSPRS